MEGTIHDVLSGISQSANVILYHPDDIGRYDEKFLDWDSRILLHQRDAKTDHPGMWGIVGGGLKSGETLLDAASRELIEELKYFPGNEVSDPNAARRYHGDTSGFSGLTLDPRTVRYWGSFTPADIGATLTDGLPNLDQKTGLDWRLRKMCRIRHTISAPLPQDFKLEDWVVTEGELMEFLTVAEISEKGREGRIYPVDKPYLFKILGLSE